ncbi:MAG: terminase [Methylobacterium sp.]|nr:terminase [Methylobacterium sp.]
MAVAAHSDAAYSVVWEPQPGPQTALVTCPIFEVFFGGARGGGKTDAMLGDWLTHSDLYGANAIGLMVRRTRLQLRETFERARVIYAKLGAKFTEVPMGCVMPNGARLNFAYLERDSDAENYQGHSYTRVYVEELGNFPSPAPVLKLMATLRSGAGVPVGFRATGNPGGPGHQWVRARYIDPAPLGYKIVVSEFINPFTQERVTRDRIFIPSKLQDNKYLGTEYVANLFLSGSEALVRAWLEGDWSVISGAFFPEFSIKRHVIAPRELPAHWTRFRSLDWGSAKPFSVGWWAISDGTVAGIPRGCLVRYREWYGSNGEPNVGLKLPAEEVAAGILKREAGETINYGVADPATFASDGGPSIIERMIRVGIKNFRRADNARVTRQGALGGWDQVRARLRGNDDGPGLLVFSTCTDLIRTLPALQHDPDRPEDVDTDGEDHAPDECRYACMSRPYVREAAIAKPEPRIVVGGQSTMTIDEAWALKERARHSRI